MQHTIQQFCHSHRPCANSNDCLRAPGSTSEPFLTPPPTFIPIDTDHPEQEAKQKTLSQKLHGLLSFAKKHYWLTAGFFIAICCIGISIYVLGATLAGVTTISIFNAHPILSPTLLFMTVYYSIFLINLCRSASKKDTLEASLEGFNRQLAQHRKHQETHQTELKDWYADRRVKLEQDYQRGREVYNSKQLKLEGLRQEINQRILYLNEILLFTQHNLSKTDLPPLFKTQLEMIRQRCLEAIQKSEEVAAIPLPVWGDATELEPLDLPDIPTAVSNDRQEIKKKLMERLKIQINEIFTYFKQNPVSAALMIGGLVLCGLAGIAIYYYLHGSSNIYFFGSLSLTSIAPMVIYGLSICYEGKTHASINELERDKEAIKKEMSQIQKERDEMAVKFDSIWKKVYTQDTHQRQKFVEKQHALEIKYERSRQSLENIKLQQSHVVDLYIQSMMQMESYGQWVSPGTLEYSSLYDRFNDYANQIFNLFSGKPTTTG